jgi:PAS domain S-box-containing protein
VDVTSVPYLGENQKPIQSIAIRTDITERKLAEEVSARFAAMVEFSDDAILSKTLDGRITSWNPGAAKLFGYPAAEVIGKTMQSFIPPERPDEEVEILARIAGGENIQHFETMRVRKDRTRIDVSVTISPIKDGQGKVIGVSKIARDNTERKRFEHALQQTNVELEHARRMAEQANRAKSEFISSMSHELRTPLNGIIGFTEFLIDEKPGPLRPKQKEYLGDVLNSGRHLLQLINDVLDLAKVEAGKMELHLETFPVRKAVEEVTAVIQGIANKKQIAIAIEIGPDLDAVMLDQHKFKQILYNLLSNAIKFSDDGGQVSIRARRLDTQQLEIAIRDAGIGIKTEDIGRLFNNFEQLDSGTARRFEGTGLGLALTKKLIEFQGGCIRVESQPAHGSIFTVVLPVEIKKEGTS